MNHIINQNYNPQKFIKFLAFKKDQGENLENWTFEELTEIIRIYKLMIEDEFGENY